MAKQSFKQLLTCLEEEHHRQECMINALLNENRLLRAETSGHDGSPVSYAGESECLTQPSRKAGAEMQRPGDEAVNIEAVSLSEVIVPDALKTPASHCELEARPLDNPMPASSKPSFSTLSRRKSDDGEGMLNSDTGIACTSMNHRGAIPSLHSVYSEKEESSDLKSNRSKKLHRSTRHLSLEKNTGNMIILAHQGSCLGLLQLAVVRPNGLKRVVWDLVSVLVVSYDVIVIPLAVMDLGSSEFMNCMDWIVTIFWTLDVPFCFLTGYHTQGAIEMRPKSVALHYLRTWFCFDFVVVSVDWFIILAAGDENAAGLLRFGKTGGRMNRIVRAFRLMRFFKMQRLLAEIMQLVKSEYVHALCNVFLSVLLILVVAHYIACGWYYTGKANLEAGNENWISNSNLGYNSTSYEYLTSLHWSLTQFTPASMEVRPYNPGERLYSIVVLFFALICFSSLLGSITSAMSQMRRLQQEQTNQQILMRKFFTDNKVSVELGQRIWRYIKKNHFNNRSRMPLEDLPFVDILPLSLKRDLCEELYRPYLTRLPFLLHFVTVDPEGLAELSLRAVGEGVALADDELFYDGQHAAQAFIATMGEMRYTDGETTASTTVRAGTWVAEPAMWFEWFYFGQLACITSCEYLCLKIDEFIHVIRDQHAFIFAKEYANAFANYLMILNDDDESTWKTDLRINCEDFHGLILDAYRKAGYDDKKLSSAVPAFNYAGAASLTQGGLSVVETLRRRFLSARESKSGENSVDVDVAAFSFELEQNSTRGTTEAI